MGKKRRHARPTAPPPPTPPGRERWVILGAALVVRVVLVFFDTYAFHPDEVFQALEPAHRAAFGYGFQVWEFADGARSWLMPGVIAGLWKMMALVGLDGGQSLPASARLLVVALSLAGTWSAMALAGRRGGRPAAVVAGVLCVVHPLVLLTSYRTLSESVAASLVLCTAALLDGEHRLRPAFAGLIGGLAVFVRFQCGLVLLIFAAQLAYERRGRELARFAAGATVAGIFGGALDWITWGAPFHSFFTYMEFNFVEGGAIYFGVERWSFYLERLFTSAGPAALVLLVGFVAGARRAPWLTALAVLFIAIHSATPHKELRFIITALPVVLVVAALGLTALARRLDRRLALVLGAALTLALAYRVPTMTYEDAGIHPRARGTRADDPVFLSLHGTNRALAWIAERRDVCGAYVSNREIIWSGGHASFHDRAPIMFAGSGGPPIAVYNYFVGDSPPDSGFVPAAMFGDLRVFYRKGPCRLPKGWPPETVSKRPSPADIAKAKAKAGET